MSTAHEHDHDDVTTTHRTRTNKRPTREAIAEANTVEAISAAHVHPSIARGIRDAKAILHTLRQDTDTDTNDADTNTAHITNQEEGER